MAFLFLVIDASAQRTAHFINGTIAEKSLVQLQLVQVLNSNHRRVAEYSIAPASRDFSFVIPADSGATYRLQVSIMKIEGRHPKLYKAFTLSLPINPAQNYTLKITPSKLDEAKKTGWELKQDIAKSSVALLSGQVMNLPNRTSGLQISMQRVEDGAMVADHSVQSNNDGSFEISSPVKKEGFYYLSSMRWKVRVYLKPADRLQLDVDHKSGKAVSFSGSPENEVLQQWHQLISPITAYGYNMNIVNTDSVEMDDYIRRYESLQPSINSFLAKADKRNPQFVKALATAIDADRQFAPLNFLFYKSQPKTKGFKPTPREFVELPAVSKQLIQPVAFNSATILAVGEARQWMNLNAKLNVALLQGDKSESLSQSEKLQLMMKTVHNDTLKSLFFNDQMVQIEVNNLSEFRETFEPFKAYAKASPAKETYKSIYALYVGDTAFIGKSSYNFSLPDTAGKIVSMKDFKGKVVLIDVWATWCGPCKAQFPFLREIEEEYAANKDLVFVGVSLDKVEVKQKWQEMIRKEKLGGIQLLDDVGNAFANKYGIRAIPRFMLIDRQGRWIEIRCPRPELKEDLKSYLDKALAEQNTVIKSN